MASTTAKTSREVKSRRTWSLAEEKALVDAYYLIIAGGYKLVNGQYRNGYLAELEKHLIKTFPNTDLREKPHIESKIKIWRKQWGYIYSDLAISGIAGNASQKMLAIEDEDVWTQLCKRDSELHKLCNKPVDWYDDWQQIFGKDRATGEHADGPADILENLSKEDYEVEASSESPANERKKKKMKLQDDLLVSMEKRQENIGSFLNTTTQLGILTQKMGHKHDLAKARREIYGIINNIDSLIKEEKLIDASKIVNEPADVDLFLSLPEEMRKDFVRMKLGGRI